MRAPGSAAAGADVAVLVGGYLYAANQGAEGGDLTARLDGRTDLERLGALHQWGDELDGDGGREGGGLDAGGVEPPVAGLYSMMAPSLYSVRSRSGLSSSASGSGKASQWMGPTM